MIWRCRHMNIIFYKTSSPENQITKSLQNALTLTGNLREGASIVTPLITLTSDIKEYNYCYITAFNRYYYIRDINQVRKNVYSVNLECDVLMSFKTEILNNTAIVERSQNNRSQYQHDNEIITKAMQRVRLKKFNYTFPTQSLILTVGGGA